MKTIQQLHDAFDRKEFSVEEWTRATLKKAQESRLNAFLHFPESRALQQAREADQKIQAAGGKVPREQFPLLGVPVAIKDNLVIEGERTTCGSKILENYIPPYTATSVSRLEQAGAISFSKTNLDEFAMGGSNENSAFGPVLHPTHPDRVPGGSSGGSAAAVGADLCVASLGSDTGGSIRLPANYCGVVGLKPTYGRISRSGLVAFASSLDQVGPFAHSVEDVATLMDVMSGWDPLDSTSARMDSTNTRHSLQSDWSWKGLKIGVPKEFFQPGLQSDVEQTLQKVLKEAEKQGAQLVSVSLPHVQHSVAVYYLVAVSEASSNLSRFDGVRFGVRPPEARDAGDLHTFYRKVRSRFGAEVKRRIVLGTFALSAGYADQYFSRAAQVRRLIQNDFIQAFQSVDLILSPVSTGTAYRLGSKTQNPLEMYLNDLFTIPANLAGIPAVSVPCGKDSEGLSIGAQWMAPAFQEDRLLGAAKWVEGLK